MLPALMPAEVAAFMLSFTMSMDDLVITSFIAGPEYTTLPMQMQADFEARFHQRIIEGYGLAEASPVVAVNPPGRVKPGTIGQPLPGIEVRVVDDGDHDVPMGKKGQLLVRGGNVMMGYWHLPDATAETLKDGWLPTGDVATQDTDGYLAIVDRIGAGE